MLASVPGVALLGVVIGVFEGNPEDLAIELH
jgi:hypothetical protein